MKNCYFNMNDACSALRVKACDGCRFFKTADEFYVGQARAAEMLKRKGLEAHILVGTEKGKVMTTRKRK